MAGGQILPVSDYVHLMPNFQAKVAAWNLDGDLNTLRQSDGKYYLLPGLHQNVVSDYTHGRPYRPPVASTTSPPRRRWRRSRRC